MNQELSSSKIIIGLMRLNEIDDNQLEKLIKDCLSLNLNFFDISDIYGRGECEKKLGRVLKRCPELRSKMIIQTKGGLIKIDSDNISLYDLSYQHIKEACNASLERMNITYVDYYLLHRPDILMEAEEVNKAIEELVKEKKIRHFGVSNFSPNAMEYLKSSLTVPLEVDQMQLGIAHLNMLSYEMNINLENEFALSRDSGVFFYLKQHDIALQCWSPYQLGFFKGAIFNNPQLVELNQAMEELAKKYHTSPCAIATSFLLRLGSNIQVVTGSTNIEHIKQTLDGTKVVLTKPEWYHLYLAGKNLLP